jgi:predicted RecB family nuclease
MVVSAPLFEAYLECSTKCWLRAHAEPSAGNTYAEWACLRNENFHANALRRLLTIFPESDRAIAPPISKHAKNAAWRIAIDVHLGTNSLDSRLCAVERAPSKGRGIPVQFIPYRFQFANKVVKNDKLMLAFDALQLSAAVGREVSFGKIIHGDDYATLKVRLSPMATDVRKQITEITALLADNSPPDLVLNRHCAMCEFQGRCRKLAMEKDELSLLSGLSEKERTKLHGKGIFTVTQLSYTFRPRRRRRALQGKQEKFHHSLRALAIRENRIHTVDLLDPQLEGTLVYLDVEGLPDRDFYYLIGVRIGIGDGAVQHSFWADDAEGEKRIWEEFLTVLARISNPRVIYYGSYETVFLKRMRERYGGFREGSAVALAIAHSSNLLSLVYARIYFPAFSNGLKDVARYLGYRWSGSPASGLETIIWRHRWETSKGHVEKQALVNYNRQDCEALQIMAERVLDLHRAVSGSYQSPQSEVVRTSDLKQGSLYGFTRNEFVLPALEAINKAAYWDYQRERIYVKSRYKKSARRRTEQNAGSC